VTALIVRSAGLVFKTPRLLALYLSRRLHCTKKQLFIQLLLLCHRN